MSNSKYSKLKNMLKNDNMIDNLEDTKFRIQNPIKIVNLFYILFVLWLGNHNAITLTLTV